MTENTSSLRYFQFGKFLFRKIILRPDAGNKIVLCPGACIRTAGKRTEKHHHRDSHNSCMDSTKQCTGAFTTTYKSYINECSINFYMANVHKQARARDRPTSWGDFRYGTHIFPRSGGWFRWLQRHHRPQDTHILFYLSDKTSSYAPKPSAQSGFDWS